jgi:hypothetical protein
MRTKQELKAIYKKVVNILQVCDPKDREDNLLILRHLEFLMAIF